MEQTNLDQPVLTSSDAQEPGAENELAVDIFPMSFAQQRMWFLYQMDPSSPAYNVPLALRLQGELDTGVLEHCINTIVERHEALRTTYEMLNDEPVQVIVPTQTIQLDRVDLSALPEREAEVQSSVRAEAQRPFDLIHGPVLRATLFLLSSQEYIFLLNFHHIAVDGWALRIFYKELTALYNASLAGYSSPLLELPIQYADFSEWQRKYLQGETYQKLVEYWRSRLGGTLPVLHLPANPLRSASQRDQGARQFFEHPQQMVRRCKAFCQQAGTTMYMTLLAAYQTLLHRCSGQDDIIVGSPIANRSRSELEGLIGFFANTLALRCDLTGNPSFLDFLKQVQATSLEAYMHQDLPFEQLVAEIQPERKPSRNPIFQSIFALQRPLELDGEMQGLHIEAYEDHNSIVKFDLELILWEDNRGLQGCFVYNLDLFDHATISRLIQYWLTLLESIFTNPEQRLSQLNLLPENMRIALLEQSPARVLEDALDTSLIDLFEARAALFPEAPALISNGQTWSYQTLSRRVTDLAAFLQQMGVKQETPVVLYLERSPELVVSTLATLKAGGACVLLDPTSPPAYLATVLDDVGSTVLLTQQRFSFQLQQAGYPLPVFSVDDEQNWSDLGTPHYVPGPVVPDTLGYIHYTPDKGVMVEQRVLRRHLQWLQSLKRLTPADMVLQTAEPGQESTLWELLWPLTSGACLVLPISSDLDNLQTFLRVLDRYPITVAHLPARLLNTCLPNAQDFLIEKTLPLNSVFVYGPEQDRLADIQRCLNVPIFSLLPLTEAATAIQALIYQSDCERGTNVLVSPVSVNRYILDEYLQLVPEGLYGELCVASPTLMRGYRSDQTTNHRRFVTPLFIQKKDEEEMRFFRTGQKARLLENGRIELRENEQGYAWFADRMLHLEAVEEAILKYSSIKECAVRVREMETGERELIAYIVPQGIISLEHLQSHLQTLLPMALVPHAYVLLSCLPVTSQGERDEATLQTFPVLDDDLAKRWQGYLQTVPGIERVAVFIEEEYTDTPFLHVSDVLPGWKKVLRSSASTQQDEIQGNRGDSGGAFAEVASKVLALSQGPNLLFSPDAPHVLADVLDRASREESSQVILHLRADGMVESQTYSELRREAEHILGGLRQLGLQPQDKVFFQFDQTRDFISAFWGCVLGGFVPVPLSITPTYSPSNSTTAKLQHAWQVLRPPVILAGENLVAPLREMAAEAHLDAFQVVSLNELRDALPDSCWHTSHPEDLALLLLTSGSTGTPKGVMLDHRNLLCRSAATAQMHSFDREAVLLNWMPLDHVGGLVMYHLLATFLSSKQIHAPIQMILEDPLKWLDLVDQYRVTDTWAPNFAYGLVNKYPEEIAKRQWNLSSLRFILNGGEAVVAKTARRFLELLQPYGLPETAMHPAWGMSETSSGITFSDAFTLAATHDTQQFVEVGAPIPGVAIRIVDDSNTVLLEGAVGQLQVKGLPITRGYYQNPELNREAFTADGWFSTGDLGKIIDGKLTITGRAKDVIIVNGMNIPCHDIEAIVEEIENIEVSFTSAGAVRDEESSTDKLALFFVTPLQEDQLRAELFKNIRQKVASTIGITVDYLVPVSREDIPKTAIGKIQRSQLIQRLAKGGFDAKLKEVDLLLKQSNILPNWFYHKRWIRKQRGGSVADLVASPILLFLDDTAMAQHLIACCQRAALKCLCIEAGNDFVQVSQDYYRIDPHVPEHYHRLLEETQRMGHSSIQRVIHCWSYTTPASEDFDNETLREQQYRGTYSLLFLTQALARLHAGEQTVQLFVVSRYVHLIDKPLSLNFNLPAATLGGLLPTISLELPWLQCSHFDLDDADDSQNAERILAEIACRNEDREIAYREGKRLVPTLEPVEMRQQPAQPLPFEEQGVYLLTGGLGGIGSFLAAYLLQHYNARVILIGRTQLPERKEWPALVEQQTPLSLRLKRYQMLEALQKHDAWCYESADVSDSASLQDLVKRAEERWQQPLSGVLHLAGEGNLATHWQVMDQHRIVNQQVEMFEAMLHAKVYGTWALYRLLKTRPQTWFLAFSSIHGLFGGSSFSAYSAASSFLDDCILYQRLHGHLQTYAINWSIWDNIGMSQDNPAYANEAAFNLGYHSVSREQGLISTLLVLARSPQSWIIGLNRDNRHIQRHLRTIPAPLRRLCAYIVKDASTDLSANRLTEVKDRFDTPALCLLQQVSELPLTMNGTVDSEQLRRQVRAHGQSSMIQQNSLPATELERAIASIWQEVLNVDHVSIDDNFFALGGHSLRLSQVHSKLRTGLELDISLVDLLQYPTIRTLVCHITQRGATDSARSLPLTDSKARAKLRRDLQKQRPQKRR